MGEGSVLKRPHRVLFIYTNVKVYLSVCIHPKNIYEVPTGYTARGEVGGTRDGPSLFWVGLPDKTQDAQVNLNFRYTTNHF